MTGTLAYHARLPRFVTGSTYRSRPVFWGVHFVVVVTFRTAHHRRDTNLNAHQTALKCHWFSVTIARLQNNVHVHQHDIHVWFWLIVVFSCLERIEYCYIIMCAGDVNARSGPTKIYTGRNMVDDLFRTWSEMAAKNNVYFFFLSGGRTSWLKHACAPLNQRL